MDQWQGFADHPSQAMDLDTAVGQMVAKCSGYVVFLDETAEDLECRELRYSISSEVQRCSKRKQLIGVSVLHRAIYRDSNRVDAWCRGRLELGSTTTS